MDIVLALPGHLGWNNMNLVLDERAKGTGYFESEPDFVTDPTNNYLKGRKIKIINLPYYIYECFKLVQNNLTNQTKGFIKDLNRYIKLIMIGKIKPNQEDLKKIIDSFIKLRDNDFFKGHENSIDKAIESFRRLFTNWWFKRRKLSKSSEISKCQKK